MPTPFLVHLFLLLNPLATLSLLFPFLGAFSRPQQRPHGNGGRASRKRHEKMSDSGTLKRAELVVIQVMWN